MKTAKFLMVFLALFGFYNVAYAANTAGVFGIPFDENQRWNACNSIGYWNDGDHGQIFMDLNTGLNPPKYHLAEDWNGKCGGSTDLGAVLYAIGDGVVAEVDDTDSNQTSTGKLLLIRHTLPDGMQRDVLNEHIWDIEINPRTGAKFKLGDSVYRGDTVARLGNSNGCYEGESHCGKGVPRCAHLHLEMRRDLSIDLHQNPYYQTLTVATALRYASPSLFIDDRKQPIVNQLTYRSYDWNYIWMYFNAPSSTAFVEYNGERYSLQRAVQAGLIWKSIWEWNGSTWREYTNVADVFFHAGMEYAIWPFVNGAELTTLVPGDHLRADRAKIDMLHTAACAESLSAGQLLPKYASCNPTTSYFTNIKTETYEEDLNPNWIAGWEWRMVNFETNQGTIRMDHLTNKTNPLSRFTAFWWWDKTVNQWKWNGWYALDMNQLD